GLFRVTLAMHWMSARPNRPAGDPPHRRLVDHAANAPVGQTPDYPDPDKPPDDPAPKSTGPVSFFLTPSCHVLAFYADRHKPIHSESAGLLTPFPPRFNT